MTATDEREPAASPAEHRARAEEILTRLERINPDTRLYRNLASAGIIHALVAVGYCLEPAPPVPGLPPGYGLATEQATRNDRRWRYVLTRPDGPPAVSQYRWGASETALIEGIRHAATDCAAAGNGETA